MVSKLRYKRANIGGIHVINIKADKFRFYKILINKRHLQVSGPNVQHSLVIRQNILRKFTELGMQTPFWYPFEES